MLELSLITWRDHNGQTSNLPWNVYAKPSLLRAFRCFYSSFRRNSMTMLSQRLRNNRQSKKPRENRDNHSSRSDRVASREQRRKRRKELRVSNQSLNRQLRKCQKSSLRWKQWFLKSSRSLLKNWNNNTRLKKI